MHGAGNVSGIVKEHIFIGLNNPDSVVFQMLLEPIGLHQCFRMRVLREFYSHKKRNFGRRLQTSKGFYNLIRRWSLTACLESPGQTRQRTRSAKGDGLNVSSLATA